MNPAFSVVLFTTIAGTAQGLVVVLAVATLLGGVSRGFVGDALLLAAAMLLVGLAASFAHLGRPERAWRAVLMWRTSWLSREVIVLPAFIAVVAAWWALLHSGAAAPWPTLAAPLAALVGAALLWYCTAMIYACLRFIEEWAQPLTLVNFVLIGLSSGLLLASAAGALAGEVALVRGAGAAGLALTLAAWAARTLALRRNAALKHRSTLATATGIPGANLRQTSMGMSAGAFNTREFFHGRTLAVLRRMRLVLHLFGFALPAACALWGLAAPGSGALPWLLAVASQVPGLLADRWVFFAQAKHPQNLYYQVVS